MQEEWHDVVGYEGLYQVSNTGKVRSMNYRKSGQSHELSVANSDRYSIVCLTKEGKQQNFTVHSLVASAFIGQRPDGYEVNHKNKNKSDNNVGNLEYVTPSQNCIHRESFGEKNRYVSPTRKPLERTKQTNIQLTINGKRTNVGIDPLTLALMPPDVVRNQYVTESVAALWQHLHPLLPLPPDPVATLAEMYSSRYTGIVATAIVWQAARNNQP